MPRNSIYLESGQVWRREQAHEKDPLRVFPELFNAKATGRSVTTEDAEVAPEFEVAEMTDCFLLSAQVPGITAAQLQVRVTAQLVIVLRRNGPAAVASTAGNPNLHHAAFRRAFVLPAAVDARRLQVDITDDLLTIKLPKRATSRSRPVTLSTR